MKKKIPSRAKAKKGNLIKRIIGRMRKKTTKTTIAAKAKAAVLEPKKKEALGSIETQIGKAKFSASEAVEVVRKMPKIQELPAGFGEDRIVLQARDPWWLHTYWEVTGQTYEKLKAEYSDTIFSAKRILRAYDVTSIIFNGSNAHRFFDIEVGLHANNWYIDTGGPGRSWCVDYGILLPDNRFIMIVRSNTVCAPIEGPSWVTDEEWMIPEDMFARLYGMGFGLRQSSPLGKGWQERLRRELFSGVLASPGITSAGSPVKKIPPERKFWLAVNTELIVYGATEPDAKVTIQEKQINLRPDGTFSLRFALPDGKQVISVHALSSDGVDERTITPIVTKETK